MSDAERQIVQLSLAHGSLDQLQRGVLTAAAALVHDDEDPPGVYRLQMNVIQGSERGAESTRALLRYLCRDSGIALPPATEGEMEQVEGWARLLAQLPGGEAAQGTPVEVQAVTYEEAPPPPAELRGEE